MTGRGALACALLAVLLLAAGSARPGPAPAADQPPPAGPAPCPSSPNCVSSRAADPDRRVAPLPLPPGPEPMRRAAAVIRAMDRSRVTRLTPGYLHAEFRSRVFGFVDDLELWLDQKAGVLQVRSAARTGWWDLGVNRRRVEELRRRLAAVRP